MTNSRNIVALIAVLHFVLAQCDTDDSGHSRSKLTLRPGSRLSNSSRPHPTLRSSSNDQKVDDAPRMMQRSVDRKLLQTTVKIIFVHLSQTIALFAVSTFFHSIIFRKTFPPIVRTLKSSSVGEIDLSPDAVSRNVADFAMDYVLECAPVGWSWLKRLGLGIDEEQSGMWAFIKWTALGLKNDEMCWLWTSARWAALGVRTGKVREGVDPQALGMGVRVRFEGDNADGTDAVGYGDKCFWGDVVRNMADTALSCTLGGGRWMWVKRLGFDLDEEEHTGLWRLAKVFALGLDGPFGGGVYTLQQPDQYPLIGRGGLWGVARWLLLGLHGPAR